MHRWQFAVLTGFVFLTAAASGLAQQQCPPNSLKSGDYTLTLQIDGRSRAFDLHVPAGVTGASPAPLVVDIHGYTRNKEDQARRSDFKTLSNANGFVVAYPQGVNNQWYAGDAVFLGNPDIDDVEFLRSLVADVAKRIRIDHSRVYATGHSNGSMLTHRLACEAADVFAGIAGMSGGLQFTDFTACRPSRPISVKMFHGLNDNIVPYNGSGLGFRPIRDTFDFWAKTNKCSGAPQLVSNGRNKCETYTNCANGTQVSLCSLVASHNDIYDVPALNASTNAWSFFQQFRLPLPDADQDGIPDADECNSGGGCTGAPDTPTGLAATNVTRNSLVASWNAAGGAESYTVQRWRNNAWTVVGTTTATSLTINQSGSQLIRVRANASCGSSGYSGYISVR